MACTSCQVSGRDVTARRVVPGDAAGMRYSETRRDCAPDPVHSDENAGTLHRSAGGSCRRRKGRETRRVHHRDRSAANHCSLPRAPCTAGGGACVRTGATGRGPPRPLGSDLRFLAKLYSLNYRDWDLSVFFFKVRVPVPVVNIYFSRFWFRF